MSASIPTGGTARVRPRVLCVDDEPHVLSGLRDVLRRKFEVVTAVGAAEGLRAMAQSGPFEVIVSDFQMPEMNGAEFLARARRTAPSSTRILLTGQVSLEGALAAVNRGYIFRLLLKPCAPPNLAAALEDAVEQFRLVTADRMLLERKLETLSSQFLRAERLATLGTLAGTVGHEMKNILMVFVTSMEMVTARAREGLAPEAVDVEALDHVRDHLTKHADHLLYLGRPRDDAGAQSDLARVVDTVLAMLRTTGLLRGVAVRFVAPPVPAIVALDRTRAEQIVMNLVKNAVDAMIDATRRPSKLSVEVAVDAAAQTATCNVTDNGSGIPTDKLACVFEPYYTTKPADRGTGLGLFVVKEILASCGGHIAVETSSDAGTTMSFRVPLSAA